MSKTRSAAQMKLFSRPKKSDEFVFEFNNDSAEAQINELVISTNPLPANDPASISWIAPVHSYTAKIRVVFAKEEDYQEFYKLITKGGNQHADLDYKKMIRSIKPAQENNRTIVMLDFSTKEKMAFFEQFVNVIESIAKLDEASKRELNSTLNLSLHTSLRNE